MPRELAHRPVKLGLVAAGLGDERARVVGNDELRAAAVEGQRTCQSVQPRPHALIHRGAGKRVARCANGGDEDLRAHAIGQRQCRTGVVDELELPRSRGRLVA